MVQYPSHCAAGALMSKQESLVQTIKQNILQVLLAKCLHLILYFKLVTLSGQQVKIIVHLSKQIQFKCLNYMIRGN